MLLLHEVSEGAARRFKLPKAYAPSFSQIVRPLTKVYRIPGFRIGERFPAGLALDPHQAGLKTVFYLKPGLTISVRNRISRARPCCLATKCRRPSISIFCTGCGVAPSSCRPT